MRLQALGREWSWPDEDDKGRKVVFDWSGDLQIAYQHCKAFDVAVQAGGNMGVWPWLLADRFELVHTFEPDPRCLPHLHENIALRADRIQVHELGLWSSEAKCSIHNEPHEARNLGAQYVRIGTGDILLTTIDSLALHTCDLIYLDIEGAELQALQGALATIERFRPVVVVEDKGLSRRFGSEKGDIEKWLGAEYGYSIVARPHRDVVLACR